MQENPTWEEAVIMHSISRRAFLAHTSAQAATLAACPTVGASTDIEAPRRPHILFAIADDWSWPHASAYGTSGIQTAAFDRVAWEGCLFTNAFTAAPQCSPNRAALLTGRNIWQLEEAGTHASIFPKRWPVWTDLLEDAGYHLGYTGKAWGPGDWERGGWSRNPVGPVYNDIKYPQAPREFISTTHYTKNFEAFLEARPDGAPFCFWFGAHEPHQKYQTGAAVAAGKRLEDAPVPAFLPDHPVVRTELLDNFYEVEWFDQHLGKMLARLEALGELDNTIVVVTSDNGISIPGAKANLREFGTHVPLAIRWPGLVAAGQTSDRLISAIDLGPTLLEAAEVPVPDTMTGEVFLREGVLRSPRNHVLTGRERHTHARYDNLGYPSRAIRTAEYLYIWNMKPERWPAGDPEGYHDIDDAPTKQFMMEQRDVFPELFTAAFGKRPEAELYDIQTDSACMHNLAASEQHAGVAETLRAALERELVAQADPRLVGPNPDVFDTYPRVSNMRPELGGFAEQHAYHPEAGKR